MCMFTGFVDDVHGWDFAGGCQGQRLGPDGKCTSQCQGRATPWDFDTHGTHVAGLVAAVQGNGLGGTGMAPGARIMILRVRPGSGLVWVCVSIDEWSMYRSFCYGYREQATGDDVTVRYPWMKLDCAHQQMASCHREASCHMPMLMNSQSTHYSISSPPMSCSCCCSPTHWAPVIHHVH